MAFCISGRSLLNRLVVAAAGYAAAAAMASPAGVVFTANERDNSITRVELDTGAKQTTKVDITPHNVEVAPDGSLLLAVGMAGHGAHGSGKVAKGMLLVLHTRGSAAPVLYNGGDHPAHVVTDASGARAFVTDSAANLVRVIDLANGKTITSVPTDKYPHGLRLSPDGRTLYVANLRGGTVSVIDANQLRETSRIPVGKAPVQVGFSADGKEAYVSLSAENRLGIIDRATGKLTHKVPVGSNPIQMHATPDGRHVYVANQGTAKKPSDTVSVVDPKARKVVATVRTGMGAHGVDISRDGKYAFVTNIEAGTLSVIDIATQKVVATHPVGAGPNGVSYME